MARQPRIEYEGALYHVMSRGNRGEAVYREDGDRELWLGTLGEACEKTGWRIHAYVMLDNHYHILLETPEANLVEGMKWFQGTCTQRINAKRRSRGHLFQGRYKALVIEPDEKMYYETVGNYIHMNPVRAGRIGRESKSLRLYRWSSFPAYVSPPKKRPSWLVVSRLLWALGLEDRARDRRRLEDIMEKMILEWRSRQGKRNLEKEWKVVRRGWFLGGVRFKDFLLDSLDEVLKGKRKESFSGEAARMHDEREAVNLLEKGLRALGVNRDDLPDMKKTAVEKGAIAWLIRTRTTTGNRWIADRLEMGHPGNIPRLVRKTKEARSGILLRYRRKLEKFLIS